MVCDCAAAEQKVGNLPNSNQGNLEIIERPDRNMNSVYNFIIPHLEKDDMNESGCKGS